MTNRKNDVDFHEILKQASIYVYHSGNAQIPVGYKVIDKAENRDNGFYAEAISNGKDVIIIYRGTEEWKDLRNDVDMAHAKLPSQCIDAVRFHDKVARENKNFEITLTGHSLGGSLGEIVSAIRNTTAVTFNAYGVRDMFTSNAGLKEDNIINYVNEWDPISMANGENLIGNIYSVQGKLGTFAHFIEHFEPLKNREYRTVEDIKKHKNIINRIENKGIYTKNQVEDIGKHIVTKVKKSINEISSCVGSYLVSGYTRTDGTKVGEYIRTCGAKHDN